MTEVPIPSTDEGGEQRGRTRNLHLRLVLEIIQNLYWLSGNLKMARTGTSNRQEQGDIFIRPRRFQQNFLLVLKEMFDSELICKVLFR